MQSLKYLYLEILGEKSPAYYLKIFQKFDQKAYGLKASWNWYAFFFGGVWALYRKMYVWFFVFLAINNSLAFFEKADYFMFYATFYIASSILFAIFSNSIYHNRIKMKISFAQLTIKDEQKLLEHLHNKGGVNIWVIWVSVAMPVLGILLAIIIPKLNDYSEYNKEYLDKAFLFVFIVIFAFIFIKYEKSIDKITKSIDKIFAPVANFINYKPISSKEIEAVEFGLLMRLCLILIYIVGLFCGGFIVFYLLFGSQNEFTLWDSFKFLLSSLGLVGFAHLGLFHKKKLEKIFELLLIHEKQLASESTSKSNNNKNKSSNSSNKETDNDESANKTFKEKPDDKEDYIATSWHKILGVSESASNEEIRTQYKRKIRDFHPDKVASLAKEFRDLAEFKAKEINYAYEYAKWIKVNK